MKTVLARVTAPAHYAAALCVFWCFDARFQPLLDAFRAQVEAQQPGAKVDSVVLAGGAKSLTLPEGDPARATALAQIALSVQLHGAAHVALMLHEDCGGYGGSRAFPTREAELAHLQIQLQAAAATVRAAFPALEVAAYIATFDGLCLL